MKDEKYQQAVELRKRGFTYSEIAKICGVSKSTVSNWLSKKKFSKVIAKENTERAARDNKKRMLLLNKTRRAERITRYKEAIRTAETEFKHYKHSPLFIAGLSLYMADGDRKDQSRIRVNSTNSELHRIFIRFLQDFMGLEQKDMTFVVTLYEGMNETKEMKWWSRHINLSVNHFGKTQFLKSSSSHTASPQQHGSGSTFVDSTLHKKKLLHWTKLLQKEL